MFRRVVGGRVQLNEPHRRNPEHATGGGCEVGEPRTNRQDQIRFCSELIGRGCAGHADRTHVAGMVPGERALAGLRFCYRHTVPRREIGERFAGIRDGAGWRAIFPGVATLRIDPNATGPGLALRITKNQGEAIHLVPEGSPDGTVIAVKRVNELDFYSMGLNDLAKKLKITAPRLLTLIVSDNMQSNSDYFKLVRIGKGSFKRYSLEALNYLHRRVSEVDLDDIWKQNRPRPTPRRARGARPAS
jgi:hypothetical protein